MGSQDLYKILLEKFQSDKDQMNKSIKKFLMQKPDDIEPYQQRFATLRDKLNSTDQSGADQNNPYDHYLKPREEDIYPEQINGSLIGIIKKHSTCDSASYTVQSRDSMQSTWHHTRICLSNGVRTKQEFAHVEFIIAAEGMKFWQEISLDVSLCV